MGNYHVRYSDDALQDIRDIFEYISFELKEPAAAKEKVKRIQNELRSLDAFPRRYKAVDWEPWASRQMRQMPVDNFIVFYVVDDEEAVVQIMRVLYGRRDIPKLADIK